MAEKKRVLIAGGGFGGVFTALEIENDADVTLVSAEDHFLFTPMLYELFSGEVEPWHVAPYYNELFDGKVRLIRGEISDIDFDNREATVSGRDGRVGYDILVLAVGGVTNYWGIPGAEEYTMPFRKLEHASALRKRMVDALDRVPPNATPQAVRSALTFVVVGAGASGVELSTKMADLLFDAFRRRNLKGEPRVVIVEMSNQVVPGMGDELREYVENALRKSRVEVYTSTVVESVSEHSVTVQHEGKTEEIPAAAVIWTAGVKVNPLVEKLPIQKNKRGLVIVEHTLQVTGHEDVFALGDIAYSLDASPKLAGTAQLALQEAGLVGDNIRALMHGRALKTKHFEELGEAVSLGTQNAAVMAGDAVFGGPLARQARFAMYTTRLPTWHLRLKVGASWFFGGTPPKPLQPLGL
jgi:NADH:ubiquinone reductase (non-electrogenic)